MKKILLFAIALVVLSGCTQAGLSQSAAFEIAQSSPCTQKGNVLNDGFYNESTKTWWFKTDIEKAGCNPHCVVWEDGSNEPEINWMCTGLIPE